VSTVAFNYERDFQGGTETWLTPKWILSPLGEFDLDPCAHPDWPTAKEHFYWPAQDGLFLPWHGRVWCNPPYAETDAWVERMALHDCGTLLIFARTDTARFRRIWATAKAMLFLYGRVAFLREDRSETDGGNAPSVLIAFGARDAEILGEAKHAGLQGAFVHGWKA
jgi:hypothetical protein